LPPGKALKVPGASTPHSVSLWYCYLNILASFPYSFNNRILPANVLENTEPGHLRSALYYPAGWLRAFRWHGVEVKVIMPKKSGTVVSLTGSSNFFLKAALSLAGEIVIRTAF